MAKRPDDPGLTEKWKAVRLLVSDVDGVLTDGSAYYDEEGMALRSFSMRDGFGIVMAQNAGIEFGVITGNLSRTIHARMKKFNVTRIKGGHFRKSRFFKEMLEETGVSAEEAVFIGDDLFDLPVMKLAGISVAPSDAHETVLERADVVTQTAGGRGVVREVVEAILRAKGVWDSILEKIENDEEEGIGS